MKVGVGYSDHPDSAKAGRQAAESAIRMGGLRKPCDVALLFCTSRHNPALLREAVASVIGSKVPIYGGGAVGIISNDTYGYAGDQVGIACFWLGGAGFDVVIDDGLLESEENTGFRLGQNLAKLSVTPETPVMLFYDSVHRTESGVRMMMATWLLAGMEKALGFMPTITGAGMMGDFECNTTSQFTGDGIDQHNAMGFVFGEEIHIDSVIMHGCRPASHYYTVTKADGPMILEINHVPALTFLDELLGGAIKPEQYPFFLLFGINSGERWAEYEEDNYASRLCLGIAPECGGIVMFEPDMVEGTEFQLMFRSLELEYMKPKIESLFDQLNGREPIFALYINCAGRCAGYGGSDIEDALVLQQTIAGRVPLLGMYSGVEVAPVAGRSRGLDWTGVLCLFSRGPKGTPISRVGYSVPKKTPESSKPSRTQLESAISLCEQNVAKILSRDAQSIMLRYELELKRRGFSLISELAVSLRQTENYEYVFIQVAQRINAALNMQKTLVLLSDGAGMFVPAVLQGFAQDEQTELEGQLIDLPLELSAPDPTIVTAAEPKELLADFRAKFNLPFFITSPVLIQGAVVALLVTGRLVEQPPYLSRLGRSDVETVQAITELLGSVLIRLQLHDLALKAEHDGLTALWNRNTYRNLGETYLGSAMGAAGAFMMIDVDYFKSINDIYGHIEGDRILIECANSMRNVMRDSDIVGRQGGDEFSVFCQGINNNVQAEKKASQILEAWRKIVPEGASQCITASIGISMAPHHGTTFQELYKNADLALYKAKAQGRNRYVLYGGPDA
jgi:diguanylate cyclase (GGDEF)-like protein